MTDDLETKLRNAPRGPGVYLMKDGSGAILYVGKARNLKARIRAYFARTDARAMIPFLVSRIRDMEFILTGTEKEALILENNLIKQHRPRYNVDFRDDKSYYNIRINPSESFPRFQLVRRPKKDGARYFGPYPSGGAAKETLRFLQTILPLRICRDRELKTRRRPCLEYEIGRCAAPCVGRIGLSEYLHLVKDGIAFLEGRERALISDLRSRMSGAAEDLRFEEASILRDRIAALEETLERQRIVSMTGRDRDVFGLCREGDMTQVALLLVRGGRMIGQKTFPLIRLPAETGEILSSLLMRYYDGVADIPDEVVVPMELEDGAILAEWLTEKKGRGVRFVCPKRGETLAVVGIAARNAENALKTSRLAAESPAEALGLLREKLKLRKPPRRIECFDISNIGGRYAVGSLVTFEDGIPAKGGYRRYRIRTVPGADDYAMMYEVLKRRFAKKDNLPDLVIVDGGKGQLGVALAVMKDLAIDGVEVLGLAKERDDARRKVADLPTDRLQAEREPQGAPDGDRTVYRLTPESDERGNARLAVGRDLRTDTPGKGEDRVYLPGRKDPVYLFRWPAALFLLQRVRDEAHRFAVSYHRKIRQKGELQSLLDRIPGIGAKRRKSLLIFLGDIERIRAASVGDLQQVEGIGREMAGRIRKFLDGEPM